MLTQPRWTHVALPVSDLDRAIEFYTTLTPLVVVARNEDDTGRGAWLSNEKQVEDPFVLVIAEFVPDMARNFGKEPGKPHPTLAPFAHIGYICAAKDPDGNVIEFSWNQRVFSTIRELWGDAK